MRTETDKHPLLNEFIDIFVQYQTVHFLRYLYKTDLSSAQINILTILNLYKEMSIKELSEFTRTSLPAASQMVSRLEKDGYVIKEIVKQPSQKQNKKKLLKLTEKGIKVIEQSYTIREKFFDDMKKTYSEEETEITEKAIKIFLDKFYKHSKGLNLPK